MALTRLIEDLRKKFPQGMCFFKREGVRLRRGFPMTETFSVKDAPAVRKYVKKDGGTWILGGSAIDASYEKSE